MGGGQCLGQGSWPRDGVCERSAEPRCVKVWGCGEKEEGWEGVTAGVVIVQRGRIVRCRSL